jgi:hypothetical protein
MLRLRALGMRRNRQLLFSNTNTCSFCPWRGKHWRVFCRFGLQWFGNSRLGLGRIIVRVRQRQFRNRQLGNRRCNLDGCHSLRGCRTARALWDE